MHTASGSRFLPNEIQRDIISQLELSSLKAIRLASKNLAVIGAEYLLPEVHLLYRTVSLERLGLISRHPIISQHVTTLFYEADRLEDFGNRDGWAEYLIESQKRARRPLVPPFAAAPELWAKYCGGPGTGDESRPYSYSELELARGWANYLDILAEQEDIAARNLDHDQIARAILCFPKLSHIYLSVRAKTRPHSNALILSYAPGLVLPPDELALELYDDPDEPTGFRQCTSLSLFTPKKRDLRSPLDTCTQQAMLRTLHICDVSWKIFSATWPAQQAVYKTVMAHVTDVKVLLDVCQRPYLSSIDELECRRFFVETGALRTFLTAAPMLEKLHVEFNICLYFQMLSLSSLVGDGEFTWKALREVSFLVNAREYELIAFFTRHKKTLRKLTIGTGLTLCGPKASVATLLPRMRDAVEWEEITMAGELFVASSKKSWYLGMPGDNGCVPPEDAGYEAEPMRAGQAVNDFLMRRSSINPFQLSSE